MCQGILFMFCALVSVVVAVPYLHWTGPSYPPLSSRLFGSMVFDPLGTQHGRLPPWEVAKAVAMDLVITDMEKAKQTNCYVLLGSGKVPYIASKLTKVGGGNPSHRAVRAVIANSKDKAWFPGKASDDLGGRPPVISDHVKREVARVAMEDKKNLVAPTPQRCRAKLPRKTINKATRKPISNSTVRRVFKVLCYDEKEDDPWQYLGNSAQEYLPAVMIPMRESFAKTFLLAFKPVAWFGFVAIDPCRSLLPRTETKSEEQKHAAMGSRKWMSKGSRRKDPNTRPAKFANSQVSGTRSVNWTPVFARGRVKIYMCGLDDGGPEKLTDSLSVAKFARDVLPRILAEMQREFGWHCIPRTVVHDMASYFVTSQNKQIQHEFASGLRAGGLRSWLGDGGDASWLAARLGDFYPHETLISHIRTLLTHNFLHTGVDETLAQFRVRLDKVEQHLNSRDFGKTPDALLRLSKSYRGRAEDLDARHGHRLPK